MNSKNGGQGSRNGGAKSGSIQQKSPQPRRESVTGGVRPDDGLRKSHNVSLSVPVPPKKIGK